MKRRQLLRAFVLLLVVAAPARAQQPGLGSNDNGYFAALAAADLVNDGL